MDALEGFGGFRSLWEVWKAFGRFSEALKGFGKLWCKHGMFLTGFVDQSCSVNFCSQLSLMSCFVCIVCIFCRYLCDSMLVRCSLWQAVPESSWYFNTILRWFLRAVYWKVVFLQCLLTSVSCFNVFLQGLLQTVYGKVVCSCSKMHAHHKSFVFFRSLAICSCSLRLCKALWGFWWYWKSLGWFERFWKALQALWGFVRLWPVLRGLNRFWEALGGFMGFGWLCALGWFGFGRLWEGFEKPWEAVASA